MGSVIDDKSHRHCVYITYSFTQLWVDGPVIDHKSHRHCVYVTLSVHPVVGGSVGGSVMDDRSHRYFVYIAYSFNQWWVGV